MGETVELDDIAVTAWDEETPSKLTHWYPRDPKYRLSGMIPPQLGDIAKCGWVKKEPSGGTLGSVRCGVCQQLRDLGL